MSGLYLLVIAAAWLAIVVALVYGLTSRVKPASLRAVVAMLVAGVLLPLPLIDEILGKRQFDQLCKDNATIHVDRTTAVGKTVYLAKTADLEVKDTWLRIVLKPWRFVDATTDVPVVSYNTLMADGGRLVRMLGISEGGVPLTFKGSCEPGGVVDPIKLFGELGVSQIQRSTLVNKEQK
jgi:hypothetical protein